MKLKKGQLQLLNHLWILTWKDNFWFCVVVFFFQFINKELQKVNRLVANVRRVSCKGRKLVFDLTCPSLYILTVLKVVILKV